MSPFIGVSGHISRAGIRVIFAVTVCIGYPRGASLDLVLADEGQALPAVMHCIVSEGGEITRCQTQDLSLEEIFVRLLGENEHDPP